MPRKKRTSVETDKTDPNTQAVAVAGPESPTDLPPIKRPAWIDGPPTPVAGEELDPPVPQKNWGDPYKPIFVSNDKGFEMGENRRFKQRVFMFKEKPDEQILARLREHGFTYRPGEKAWTIAANAETRVLSDRLAREFAVQTKATGR